MRTTFTKTLQLYRDAYEGHPKEVWALAILTLINRMGTMVLPFLSVYLTTELGFSLKEAGVLVSAFGLGSLAGAYGAGYLIDRFGSRMVIIMSLFVSGFFLISLQFATGFLALFLLIFVTSLFGEAYRPAMSSAVGEYVPRAATGRTMALIRLAINLGMSASPAIGGFIAASLGYKWLFWIDGLTCIAAAGYYWHSSRHWQARVVESAKAASVAEAAASLPPHKNGSYLLFLAGTLLLAFVFMQWFHSVPVFLKSEWGFDERYIGILLAVSSLMVVVIEMPLIHAIEKARKIRITLLAGLSLVGLSYLLFLLPPALAICFAAIAVWTLGEICVLPFNTSIPLHMSHPSRRGAYLSWYWMTWSLANILGPVAGLAFADEFGFSAFWIVLSLLMGLSLLAHWRLGDKVS